MRRRFLLLIALTVFLPGTARAQQEGVAFFEKKIRPALVEHCYSCHSVDAQKNKKLKAGLYLDSREGVRKGGVGGPAVVPGDVKGSLLLKALRHEGDTQMPPKGPLPKEVVADFEKWVKIGAPDPREGKVVGKREIDVEAGKKWWAFQPLKSVTPPAVKDAAWVKNPIDRFILAKLEEKGLKPNAAVSREKLIRRATFDLWGLPPTADEVARFAASAKPQASYDELIDKLLADPHYGERWARHWLDVVRFAESGGYEFDGDRPGAYHYRDFVIKALNQGMPYDEFVRLQIAGDQLRPGDFLGATATGFLVAGPYPGQTTAKTIERIRYDHLDDMASTFGNSLLGLSLGCVRCHEHKYDPIPQQDYYRLLACIQKTDSTRPKLDPDPEATKKAKAAFDAEHAPLVAALTKYRAETMPVKLQAWAKAEQQKPAPAWLILNPVTATGKAALKKLDDGSVLAAGKADKNETYTIVARTHQRGITSIRLDALIDASLPKSGPGRGPDGGFVLTSISVTAAPLDGKGKPVAVKLKPGKATFEAKGQTLAAALVGDKKAGWSVAGHEGKPHAAIFETETPVGFEGGTQLTVVLKFEGTGLAIGRPRLAIGGGPLDGAAELQHRREALSLLGEREREAASAWFRKFDPELNKLFAAVEEHQKKQPQPKLVDAFVAGDVNGNAVFLLTRGEVDRKGAKPNPGFVQVLMNTPERDDRWTPKVHPRVALANWVTDADKGAGHLLARVIVNRLWQHHMGKGLVATPNDFGAQGEPPTHPELLDYLASELIRGGWKLRPIHKLIMTSATYAQAGELNDAAAKIDPANKLWWRRPPRRLEAEAIRDALLAVSGTLDPAMYGAGTLDENSPRRSVYLTVKRSKLVPFLQMFDAPEAIQSIGVRPSTTVATQALAMMNSPLVRQRAEKFAQRVRPKSPGELPQAIDEAYLTALARRPTDTERQRMTAFIARQAESYGKSPQAQDRALADFCQVLLCVNEFIYVD